jgi:hypothetical protein
LYKDTNGNVGSKNTLEVFDMQGSLISSHTYSEEIEQICCFPAQPDLVFCALSNGKIQILDSTTLEKVEDGNLKPTTDWIPATEKIKAIQLFQDRLVVISTKKPFCLLQESHIVRVWQIPKHRPLTPSLMKTETLPYQEGVLPELKGTFLIRKIDIYCLAILLPGENGYRLQIWDIHHANLIRTLNTGIEGKVIGFGASPKEMILAEETPSKKTRVHAFRRVSESGKPHKEHLVGPNEAPHAQESV